STQEKVARRLLHDWGRTYASEAGISLRGGASSLFQLLCLALLSSARIRADIAVDAMRALRDAGWRDARAMADATWKERTDVLNRSGYARYDESTSRMLAATAELALERYHGDLREMRDAADGDVGELRRGLKQFKGIGDVGADIFLREAQGVWTEARPFFDDRSLRTAERLGLPADAADLSSLCEPDEIADLAAALARIGLAGPEAIEGLRDEAV